MTENGVTIVDFAAMSEAVNGYKQKTNTLQTIMQALQGVQAALSAANIFTGGAASSMIATIGAYIKAIEAAINSLNSVVKLLEDKLTKYQEADKKAAAVAESIELPSWSEV